MSCCGETNQRLWEVERYTADGHGPNTEGPDEYASRREALAAVRRELGVRRIAAWRRWVPEPGVEGYHASRVLGCGGVTIRRTGQ